MLRGVGWLHFSSPVSTPLLPNKSLGILIKSGVFSSTCGYKHSFLNEMALKAVIHVETNNFKKYSEIVQNWRKSMLLICSLFYCGWPWCFWKMNREKFALMRTIDYSGWYSQTKKCWGNQSNGENICYSIHSKQNNASPHAFVAGLPALASY